MASNRSSGPKPSLGEKEDYDSRYCASLLELMYLFDMIDQCSRQWLMFCFGLLSLSRDTNTWLKFFSVFISLGCGPASDYSRGSLRVYRVVLYIYIHISKYKYKYLV